MVRKVLLKRIQNWVRQLAEKLWQPSVDEESCGNTRKNKLLSLQYLAYFSFTKPHSYQLNEPRNLLHWLRILNSLPPSPTSSHTRYSWYTQYLFRGPVPEEGIQLILTTTISLVVCVTYPLPYCPYQPAVLVSIFTWCNFHNYTNQKASYWFILLISYRLHC